MSASVAAICSGFVFAIGLAISGMTQPQKVIGFLDVTGEWDPALAFVMVGAIADYFIGLRVTGQAQAPLLSDAFHPPQPGTIDARLLLGSVLFGFGWGLSGFCPAPALTSLTSGSLSVVVFVGSMVAGMWLFSALPSPTQPTENP